MHSTRTWMHGLLAAFVAVAVLVAPLALPRAQAQNNDAVAQARAHYDKGNSLFAKGDFQGAIAEFAEADRLASSPMLEYNIALCYDRLGDGKEALRRYRLYLQQMPGASNRAAVEGKIARIEGEIRAAAEADRKAADARRAEEAKARAEEEARRAEAAKTVPDPAVEPESDPDSQAQEVYTPGGPGTTGAAEATPVPRSAGPAAASYQTSDPDLRRVSAVNVAAIRDQNGSYQGDSYQGGEAGAQAGAPDGDPNGQAPPPPGDEPKKEKPVYKQWWFWAVVVVGGIVVYSFATDDSGSGNSRLILPPGEDRGSAPSEGGLTWSF